MLNITEKKFEWYNSLPQSGFTLHKKIRVLVLQVYTYFMELIYANMGFDKYEIYRDIFKVEE